MKRKNKAKLRAFIIFAIFCAVVFCVIRNFGIAADEYAQYDVKNTIRSEIFDSFSNITAKYKNEIKGISQKVEIDGDVTGLVVDSVTLNKITAELTFDVTRRLESEKSIFLLPLGNVTRIKLFSGKGPGIKIKAVPLGNVSVGAESSLTSAGINQTVHRITIRVNALVGILLPFRTKETEISCEYVISEMLIVGKVPELYYMREDIP